MVSCRTSRSDRGRLELTGWNLLGACTPNIMTQQKSDLLQGTLDLLILKTLQLDPMHGWGISQRIQQISDGVLRVNQGSLYPALHRLEQQGWIASEWGITERKRNAKFYRLTKIGRKQLESESSSWAHVSSLISKVMQTA